MEMRSLQLMALLVLGVLFIAISNVPEQKFTTRILLAGLGGGLLGTFVGMIA